MGTGHSGCPAAKESDAATSTHKREVQDLPDTYPEGHGRPAKAAWAVPRRVPPRQRKSSAQLYTRHGPTSHSSHLARPMPPVTQEKGRRLAICTLPRQRRPVKRNPALTAPRFHVSLFGRRPWRPARRLDWIIHHRDTENTENGTPTGYGSREQGGFDMVFDPAAVQSVASRSLCALCVSVANTS
jgi:hypothetical protein